MAEDKAGHSDDGRYEIEIRRYDETLLNWKTYYDIQNNKDICILKQQTSPANSNSEFTSNGH